MTSQLFIMFNELSCSNRRERIANHCTHMYISKAFFTKLFWKNYFVCTSTFIYTRHKFKFQSLNIFAYFSQFRNILTWKTETFSISWNKSLSFWILHRYFLFEKFIWFHTFRILFKHLKIVHNLRQSFFTEKHWRFGETEIFVS